MLAIVRNVVSQVVVNAYFAVDTFFFQSGLLLAFVWFKKYRQNPSATTSFSAWFLYYFHRIVRLSPAYYFAIAFYTWVFTTWLVDMPVFLATIASTFDFCDSNWWIDFLYLQNFIDVAHQVTPVLQRSLSVI